tara:strand:- start:181 stop:615 length:435 start_codon:yes stop_codon:yes gene_type:complete
MAKVSKSLLKEIVKECLVEILAEGISGGNVTSLSESIDNAATSSRKSNIMQNMLPPKKKVKNERFESNLDNVISNTTKDPIMAELLADTAKTTLQEQNTADSPNKFTAKATDSASRAVADSSPEELFGGAAGNWAQLAFSDSNK